MNKRENTKYIDEIRKLKIIFENNPNALDGIESLISFYSSDEENFSEELKLIEKMKNKYEALLRKEAESKDEDILLIEQMKRIQGDVNWKIQGLLEEFSEFDLFFEIEKRFFNVHLSLSEFLYNDIKSLSKGKLKTFINKTDGIFEPTYTYANNNRVILRKIRK